MSTAQQNVIICYAVFGKKNPFSFGLFILENYYSGWLYANIHTAFSSLHLPSSLLPAVLFYWSLNNENCLDVLLFLFFLVLYYCYGYIASFKILSASRYSHLNRINIYFIIITIIILYSIKTNIHHIVCRTILSIHLTTYFCCSIMHAPELDRGE